MKMGHIKIRALRQSYFSSSSFFKIDNNFFSEKNAASVQQLRMNRQGVWARKPYVPKR